MNKKKIFNIVSYSILAVVLVTALIMALIKVNGNVRIDTPTDVYITCKATQSHPDGRGAFKLRSSKESDKEKISLIYDALNRGFQQSALVALFRGELSQGTTECFDYSAGESTNSISKNFSTNSTYTVYFYYAQPKTITVGTKTFEYQYLFFEVPQGDSRALVTFGVNSADNVDVSTESTEEVEPDTKYEYNYKAYVNLKEVHGIISSWDLTA